MKVKIPIYKKVLTKSEVEVDIQKVIDKLLLKNQDIIVDSLIDALNEDMEEYIPELVDVEDVEAGDMIETVSEELYKYLLRDVEVC